MRRKINYSSVFLGIILVLCLVFAFWTNYQKTVQLFDKQSEIERMQSQSNDIQNQLDEAIYNSGGYIIEDLGLFASVLVEIEQNGSTRLQETSSNITQQYGVLTLKKIVEREKCLGLTIYGKFNYTKFGKTGTATVLAYDYCFSPILSQFEIDVDLNIDGVDSLAQIDDSTGLKVVPEIDYTLYTEEEIEETGAIIRNYDGLVKSLNIILHIYPISYDLSLYPV